MLVRGMPAHHGARRGPQTPGQVPLLV